MLFAVGLELKWDGLDSSHRKHILPFVSRYIAAQSHQSLAISASLKLDLKVGD